MTETPKTVNTVTMSATCPSHARTDLAARDVELTCDEPIARGGTNLGFTPTETFIASLSSLPHEYQKWSLRHRWRYFFRNYKIYRHSL